MILNFTLVFSGLSDILKCKKCDSDIKFGKHDEHGLGFNKAYNKAYEIDRRIVFVMRLLGVGFHGLNCFCSMMDLGRGFSRNLFYVAVDNMYTAAQRVFQLVIKKAGREEKEKTAEDDGDENNWTVSGDGSWSKRGFTSNFGVITLVGNKTSKVLDLIVKSSFCQGCVSMKNEIGRI